MSTTDFSIPKTMTAIEIAHPGGPEVLAPTQRPVPRPGTDEVLIRVAAAGVNGPDVLQRKGLYSPPQGASDIPGLEVSGEIVEVGADVRRFKPGDLVCALLTGGGYAEYAVANQDVTMHLPKGLDLVEAAAMPESFMTVWLNMIQRGQLCAGESVLIHGGASGIGTTATMIAKAIGASNIMTTVSSPEKAAESLKLGASHAINYHEEDFVAKVEEYTGGKGVDVILDIIGGDYVGRNFAAAGMNGRILQVSALQGPAKDLNLWPMMTKLLVHSGSTLRSRPNAEKAAIIAELEQHVWPLIESGKIKPLVYKTFPLGQAGEAHALIDSGQHIGKIVLTNGV